MSYEGLTQIDNVPITISRNQKTTATFGLAEICLEVYSYITFILLYSVFRLRK